MRKAMIESIQKQEDSIKGASVKSVCCVLHPAHLALPANLESIKPFKVFLHCPLST